LKIEIIKNQKDWAEFLSLVDSYDSYHTYDYHILSKLNDETPILLKYEHLGVLIGLPFLVRKIENSEYKDLTSVYGYPGPISKGVTNHFNNAHFKIELIKFLKLNNFICAFSRLNPFIAKQLKILINFGTIIPKGKVVNIDITKKTEIQRVDYQKRLKTYINKSRRNSSVIKASSKADLKVFIDIYYKNMKRVDADDFYFFDELYFKNLVDSEDFKTEILLAKDNNTNEIMAGCLFLISNGIVQYHLSGTKEEFLDQTPTKLLIDEMRVIATNRNLLFFNLGGGLGGREDDSLFNFKSSFSKNHKDFNIWKIIIDENIYNNLVIKTKADKNTEYFPIYRS